MTKGKKGIRGSYCFAGKKEIRKGCREAGGREQVSAVGGEEALFAVRKGSPAQGKKKRVGNLDLGGGEKPI